MVACKHSSFLSNPCLFVATVAAFLFSLDPLLSACVLKRQFGFFCSVAVGAIYRLDYVQLLLAKTPPHKKIRTENTDMGLTMLL